MNKIKLTGLAWMHAMWIHRGYTVLNEPRVSLDGVTTNQYEVWGPDADGTTFIAQAHSLLGAKEVIDADLTRLASMRISAAPWHWGHNPKKRRLNWRPCAR